MRDNHDGFPEILDAVEQNGQYFCFVQLERHGQRKRFRFGIIRKDYEALKRIFQIRPFEQMPGVRYRYFFVPRVGRLDNDRMTMAVRVEQGNDGKQINAEAGSGLVANLLWFYELGDWAKAEYLSVLDTPSR